MRAKTRVFRQITLSHAKPAIPILYFVRFFTYLSSYEGRTNAPKCRLRRQTGKHFFFQAEDGIRDGHVTGVQTCAIPISSLSPISRAASDAAVASSPRSDCSVRL